MRNTDTNKRESVHRFSYRIRMENLSPHHVQLLGRYSKIQELEEDEVEHLLQNANKEERNTLRPRRRPFEEESKVQQVCKSTIPVAVYACASFEMITCILHHFLLFVASWTSQYFASRAML